MSKIFRSVGIVALLAFTILTITPVRPAAAVHVPNTIVRNGWVVNWDLTVSDGIRIFNVTYNGHPFIREARLPGILVVYTPPVCFFYDELMSTMIYDPATIYAGLYLEDVAGGGFQLRGDYDVPGYDYMQIWRFNPDGSFLGLLRIGAGGCYATHTYTPRWRYDFALSDGTERNRVAVYNGGNNGPDWSTVRKESSMPDSGLRDPAQLFTNWRILNRGVGFYFTPYAQPEPTANGTLLVVQNHPNEIETPHPFFTPPQPPTIYVNGESTMMKDDAIWYLTTTHPHNPFVEPTEPMYMGLIFYPVGFA